VASPEAAAQGLGFRAETGFGDGMTEFAQAPLRRPVSAGRPSQEVPQPTCRA